MIVYPVLHKGAVREEEACKGDKDDKGEERARKRKRWSRSDLCVLLLQDTIP